MKRAVVDCSQFLSKCEYRGNPNAIGPFLAKTRARNRENGLKIDDVQLNAPSHPMRLAALAPGRQGARAAEINKAFPRACSMNNQLFIALLTNRERFHLVGMYSCEKIREF